VLPEAASLAVDSGALSRGADVLAGKAARYDINNSCPRSAVKTANVRPDGKGWEKSIVLPLRQNGCAVGITLNCAHGAPSEEVASKNASAATCEKSQLIHAVGTGPRGAA
jgi:hypothetical protein